MLVVQNSFFELMGKNAAEKTVSQSSVEIKKRKFITPALTGRGNPNASVSVNYSRFCGRRKYLRLACLVVHECTTAGNECRHFQLGEPGSIQLREHDWEETLALKNQSEKQLKHDRPAQGQLRRGATKDRWFIAYSWCSPAFFPHNIMIQKSHKAGLSVQTLVTICVSSDLMRLYTAYTYAISVILVAFYSCSLLPTTLNKAFPTGH